MDGVDQGEVSVESILAQDVNQKEAAPRERQNMLANKIETSQMSKRVEIGWMVAKSWLNSQGRS